jgi:hypothetical protein
MYSYPTATLFIDGKRYEENQTNSDIIDAHELDSITATGLHVTYVGACYNARSHTFSNYFNGEVAGLSLFKEQPQQQQKESNKIECLKNCKEYLDLNMIGNENFLKSIELIENNLIKIKTQTYTDLVTLIQKISFVNKKLEASETLDKSQMGKRYVRLTTEILCFSDPNNSTDSSKSKITVDGFVVDLDVRKPSEEFNIKIDGNREYVVSKNVLLNKGINLFKEISISKNTINQVNGLSSTQDDGNERLYFSSCSIKIVPNEKIVLRSFNDDEILGSNDDFKLSRDDDVFIIDGLNSIEDYEVFLKNLVYSINENENGDSQKLFYLSCIRNEPRIETNTVLIQVY